MATSAKFRHAPHPAQTGADVLEQEIVPGLRAHLTEKLNLPPEVVNKIANDLREKVYRALVSLEQNGITEVMVDKCGKRGVDLRDENVRLLVQGAVKGILKARGLDTKIPGREKEKEPLTVYVNGVTPPPAAAKPVTYEGVPPLRPRQKTPEAAKTPLTAMKLPTQPLPPAPELPAKDPRRSSAQLPSIRREPTVEKAFKAAAELLRSRYPEGTFPSMADFLADAYNDQEPNPEKNLRKKLEKWSRQFWAGSDEEKSSPNFEREIEKAFLAGFGDRYCKQQHRDRTEAVKKRK